MNPFLGALDVLDRRGWIQGAFDDGPDGGVCIAGAIHVAAGYTTTYYLAWAMASQLCGKALSCFNDDPATSEEDVRLLLKHAAAAWDEEHQ